MGIKSLIFFQILLLISQLRNIQSETDSGYLNPKNKDLANPIQNYWITPISSNGRYYDHCDSTVKCNTRKNLTCDQTRNICICLPHHVYIHQTDGCEIFSGKQDSESECTHDSQCHAASNWGPLSRCNKITSKCECFDFPTGGSNKIIHSDSEQYGCIQSSDGTLEFPCILDIQCRTSSMGELSMCDQRQKTCVCEDPRNPGNQNVQYYPLTRSCFQTKKIEYTCDQDEECWASISPHVICRTGGYDMLPKEKTCQCPVNYVWSEELNQCLQIGDGTLSFQCESDLQCRASSLGPYSECDRHSKKCFCNSYKGEGDIVVYNEKMQTCVQRKHFGVACLREDDCELFVHPNATCLGDIDKTCQCHPDKYCSGTINVIGNSGMILIFVTAIISV